MCIKCASESSDTSGANKLTVGRISISMRIHVASRTANRMPDRRAAHTTKRRYQCLYPTRASIGIGILWGSQSTPEYNSASTTTTGIRPKQDQRISLHSIMRLIRRRERRERVFAGRSVAACAVQATQSESASCEAYAAIRRLSAPREEGGWRALRRAHRRE